MIGDRLTKSKAMIANQSQGNKKTQEIQVDKTTPQIISSVRTFKIFRNTTNCQCIETLRNYNKIILI